MGERSSFYPTRSNAAMPNEGGKTRIDRLRLLRDSLLECHELGMASFLDEQLVVSSHSVDDVYSLALSYHGQQQYERALELLNQYDAINKNLYCRLLAARCSLALSEGADALDYLGHSNPFTQKNAKLLDNEDTGIKVESLMCFTRAKSYLLLGNYRRASDSFKEALKVDTRCSGALDSLVKLNSMTEKEEFEFVTTLPYEEHCGEEAGYFRYLYGLKLKRNIRNSEKMVAMPELDDLLEVHLFKAKRYMETGDFENCLKICETIRKRDSFYMDSIVLHITCLFELNKMIELYKYSTELVERKNMESVTWYAVGLVHLNAKKNTEAREYFKRSLTLDNLLQEAWIGYGHSFAYEKEHEQAITAYMSASRLAPESHVPLLNIGMEYMLQNQLEEASNYFARGLHKNQNDPVLHNEAAVCFYKMEQYVRARSHLHLALQHAQENQSGSSPIWEKIWCNLGHVYRHPPLLNYDRALKCLLNAKDHNPNNSDVRATIGMIYHIQNKTMAAIAEYYVALENSKDPASVNELLQLALKSQSEKGVCDPFSDEGMDFANLPELSSEIQLELDDAHWT
ncbi:uncharacterized protein EV154DRAFT_126729 [Mucor mucedo]|uniref:uncharacterized protein n=1 Tax=Mucor mucedo TaxID=29922 RepID=UPI0022201D10|nr:uncharacterized protein EV154DRAFT_126729 [Mucor mucedo]KAI7869829.1 hypothetical protein EV154DRAFT_126729 [Mucor mucedo]